MKRSIIGIGLALGIMFFIGSSLANSQAIFKIPFKFKAEGKTFPPGDYWISQAEEGKITLRKETGGEDILIPFTKMLEQADPPVEEPQLVFDMVANFEPSYTEYITDYMLAEVWLTEKEGYLVLAAERSEYRKIIKGVKVER